jgi:heat shock protein HslJ
MNRGFLLIILLAVLSVAVSAQSLEITGRQWMLVGLDGSSITTSTVYFEFQRDMTRFSGNAGCNRMFGSMKTDGQKIAFSNVATTRMACVDAEKQKIETAVLIALTNVDGIRQRGSSIELMHGRRIVMKLAAPVKQKPQK